MTKVTFDRFGDNELTVLCPACGGNWTHQRRVETFFRREDAATGTHVSADGSHTTIDPCLHGNPSRRRDGVRIWIECENCEHQFDLTIVQHKGQTLVNCYD
ncbi:MAG: hypothetical protein WAK16_04050 [Candidatus Cybelea sp.]